MQCKLDRGWTDLELLRLITIAAAQSASTTTGRTRNKTYGSMYACMHAYAVIVVHTYAGIVPLLSVGASVQLPEYPINTCFAHDTITIKRSATICAPNDGAPDVYFYVPPGRVPAGKRITVTTCGLSSFKTLLAAYEGVQPTRADVAFACNDYDPWCANSNWLYSRISWVAVGGKDYTIVLTGYPFACGEAQIRVSVSEP